MNHREKPAPLSVIGGVPVPLGLIAWAAEGLQVLNIERQFGEVFPWLDVVKVDWEQPTVLAPTLTAHQTVASLGLLTQGTPLHRVEEWVSRDAQRFSHLVVSHFTGAHRP
jgi:hypothetical protein